MSNVLSSRDLGTLLSFRKVPLRGRVQYMFIVVLFLPCTYFGVCPSACLASAYLTDEGMLGAGVPRAVG